MGRTGWILAGLVLGALAGVAARTLPSLLDMARLLHPVGQLWLNALRMTLVPLVFCVMTNGIGQVARAAAAGRLLGLTIGLFFALLVFATFCGAVLALGLMQLWPVAPLGSALLASAGPRPPVPDFVSQLVAFVPVNPVAAAAQTEITPLIVFAAVLGAALARVKNGDTVFALLRAVTDAMLVVVGWVLWLAPLGVFLLALDAVSSVGGALVVSLAQYLILLCLVLLAAIPAATLVGAIGGGLGLGRFQRAIFPSQALAASTQSSLSALPTMLTAAMDGLALPPALVSAILPLACTVFRFGNVWGGVAAGLIGAALCGIHPAPAQIVLAGAAGCWPIPASSACRARRCCSLPMGLSLQRWARPSRC